MVLVNDMKKLLPLLLAIAALPLFQSCVGPGYNASGYGSASNYGASVGIIATSHSRWGYDPYYRSYYDFSLGQYYNLNSRRYYTSLPRRYSSPYYPSSFRRGTTLRAPSRLPYLNSSFRRSSVGFINTGSSRWAYDPYRRSYYDRQSKRYYNTSSRSYYNSLPRRHSSPQYPNGYRSGQRVQLHSNLPYVNHRTSSNRSNQGSSARSSSQNFRNQRSSFNNNRTQRPNVGSSNSRSRSNVNSRPPSSSSNRSSSSSNRSSTRTRVTPQTCLLYTSDAADE